LASARMNVVKLLLIAASLIGVTPSLADSFAPRSFGYPSYAGAAFQGARVWLVSRPYRIAAAPPKGGLPVAIALNGTRASRNLSECLAFGKKHRPQLWARCPKLGPLGRSPTLPQSPTPEDVTILGLIMAFWGRGTTKGISDWLGHRSITSTAVYTALAPPPFREKAWRCSSAQRRAVLLQSPLAGR
jgi:hypothetical protein